MLSWANRNVTTIKWSIYYLKRQIRSNCTLHMLNCQFTSVMYSYFTIPQWYIAPVQCIANDLNGHLAENRVIDNIQAYFLKLFLVAWYVIWMKKMSIVPNLILLENFTFCGCLTQCSHYIWTFTMSF